MPKVNLEALLKREDLLLIGETGRTPEKPSIGISDLLPNSSYMLDSLCKPDFQRITDEWDTEKIVQFLDSFLDEDLIPAIIAWRNSERTVFIIDGSHRLSCLLAWVKDDYGDGMVSQNFYNNKIPTQQIRRAQETRKKIEEKIGSYREFELSLKNPMSVRPEIIARAKALGTAGIKIQWVDGDASKAEKSFLRINKLASPINQTELELIESRAKPNSIAARAISHGGEGHKYWSGFAKDKKIVIQNIATKIHELLFKPELSRGTIDTLELPMAGGVYDSPTLPLIWAFVNQVNHISPKDYKTLADDKTGDETIKFLQECLNVVELINSKESSSIGLHPAVYFYSTQGKHKTATFFLITGWLLKLKDNPKLLTEFMAVRPLFESALIEHDYIIPQIMRHYRSGKSSAATQFYFDLAKSLNETKNIDLAIKQIKAMPNYSYLKTADIADDKEPKRNFDSETKSNVFLKTIKSSNRCALCGGYIHKNALTYDHKERKREGGMATVENAQFAHPYCNQKKN